MLFDEQECTIETDRVLANIEEEHQNGPIHRLKVLNTMLETGMVPVFYHADIDVARKVAAACAAGGGRLLEFTNRGDHAWEVFTELERYCCLLYTSPSPR